MLVALVGVVAALGALALYLLFERPGAAGLPLAALRAVAWGGVAALLVNPGCRSPASRHPVVLLDASRSMTDPNGDARWRAALDSARAIAGAGGRVVLFGDEPRAWTPAAVPDMGGSRLLPALREAAAGGGPIVVITDGELDDAAAIPSDLRRAARVILVPRPDRADAAVAALDIPAALRAGDTATAVVDVAARGAAPGDSGTLELLEAGRIVVRARVPLGDGGVRRTLTFVPAPTGALVEERRYEVRLRGFAGDGDPRNDARATVAAVSRSASVVLVSDSPDYDVRWLGATLEATSGLPVRVFVRVGEAGWRDARSLRPVGEAQVRQEASRAAVVVAHGSAVSVEAFSRLATGPVWRWPAAGAGESAGDWYVTPSEFASPIGAALAGVPTDSLPPLEAVRDLRPDSVQWTGLSAQLNRRGRAQPLVQGIERGARRSVVVSGSGLWRWAARGGVALEGYRALVASLTDWLVASRAGGSSPALLARRDALARDAVELLPRLPSLGEQAGLSTAGASEAVPLRHGWLLHAAILLALVAEWAARRRLGLR